MLQTIARALAVAALLTLTGCLWGPGKFTSELVVRKDGSFVLDYKGEIVLATPPEESAAAEPWKDEYARCYEDGRTESSTNGGEPPSADEGGRACTAAEIAALKADYERAAAESAAAKRKENEEMAKLFGLPGLDDESSRAFAAKLMKYEGWRSVTYRGNGIFDVDYHLEGRATQDFIFPALPDNEMIVPFIAIRPRTDGLVLVTAPALTGGQGAVGNRVGAVPGGASRGPPSQAEGILTIVTDGEFLTNNSEDGASAHPIGRQLRWDVTPASTKSPETLIGLR